MGINIGRKARIAFSTDGVAYNDLGKVLSGDFDDSSDIADATTNDSLGFKEGEYADSQVTIDVVMKYDSSNTAQAALIQAKQNKVKGYLRFRPSEETGELQWIALFTLDTASISTSTGEVEELNVSATSSGTVAKSSQ